MIADKSSIRTDRNDLSYVTIAVADAQGNTVPDADIPVTMTVSGDGEIAGSGSASPNDMESVNSPVCKTYRGMAVAILRPSRDAKKGNIKLKVEANGLTSGELIVTLK